MQIVKMHLVLDAVVPVLVRLPVSQPGLDPAAGQPHREPVRIVIPPVSVLRRRRSPEFPAPDDQRLV